MAKIEIHTVEHLCDAFNQAQEVRVQIRFGTCEEWVKVPKKSVVAIINAITGTPVHNEMYTGCFGTYEVFRGKRILYLG